MVIYITINLINRKKYIGADTRNNPLYLGSGKILKQAIKKYGKKNFMKILIESCDSVDHLFKQEIYWINFFNAVNDVNFYNLLSGGQGCLVSAENPMFNTNLLNIWTEKYGPEKASLKMTELGKKRSKLSKLENNSMYGKRNPRAKYIAKFDKNRKLINAFKSVREASNMCKHKRVDIARWRKRKLTNRNGHIWEFISEAEYLNFKNET